MWLNECVPIAAALDRAHDTTAYASTLRAAEDAFANATITPSARVLAEMAAHRDSYLTFALTQSLRHRSYLRELPWDGALDERYASLATESREAQQKIEAADTLDFESYRRQYLALELSTS